MSAAAAAVAPGHGAAQDQREREEPVAEPREQAAASEPADAGLELALLPPGELALAGERGRALAEVERLDEAEVEDRAERGVAQLHETIQRQLAFGHHLPVGSVRHVQPEAARLDVRLDVHREELLALRVADDRLERPQELEVTIRRCRHMLRGRGRVTAVLRTPKATWMSSGVKRRTTSVSTASMA